MSESSGPHSVNTPSEQGVGSAGQSLKGCKTKIDIDINRLVMLSFLSFFAKPKTKYVNKMLLNNIYSFCFYYKIIAKMKMELEKF